MMSAWLDEHVGKVGASYSAPGLVDFLLRLGGGAGDIAGNANGASAPLTVQFIDLNGDPSIPAAAWWALSILAAALATLGWRYRSNKAVP